MTQESGTGILGSHAAAIVGNSQKGHATVPDLYRDLAGAGIHRVFQQFLHHTGRAFDYLTGGDQIGDMGL